MNFQGKERKESRIICNSARRCGLRARVAAVPGVIIAHRVLKNLRYWTRVRRNTVGGIHRSSMTVTEAVNYTESIFAKVDELVDGEGGWSGRRVLEIGPGDSLGTGAWCLAAGASSYVAIDRFAVEFDLDFEQDVHREISLRTGTSPSSGGLDEFPAELPQPVSSYHNDLPVESAPGVFGSGAFDVIFSNAVFEHVGDPYRTLRALWTLLAPGGVMFHDVDLRSHQTYEPHPLAFLEYPNWLWHLMSSHNGEPNRARMRFYVDSLSDLGFVDIRTRVSVEFDEDLIREVRPRLAREFRNMEPSDLRPAVFAVTARKPL